MLPWLWYRLTWKENIQIHNSLPFFLLLLFKRRLGSRVCAEAAGDTATLWSIRACDGFCIDQENVGWWSGLEGVCMCVCVAGGGAASSSLMAATLRGRGKGALRLFLSSSLLTFLLRSLSLCLSYARPLWGLVEPPLLSAVWLVKCCGKQLPLV